MVSRVTLTGADGRKYSARGTKPQSGTLDPAVLNPAYRLSPESLAGRSDALTPQSLVSAGGHPPLTAASFATNEFTQVVNAAPPNSPLGMLLRGLKDISDGVTKTDMDIRRLSPSSLVGGGSGLNPAAFNAVSGPGLTLYPGVGGAPSRITPSSLAGGGTGGGGGFWSRVGGMFGGGGSGGGGGGGGFAGAAAGGFGFGGVASLLAGGIEGEVIYQAVKEVATAPQHLVSMAAGMMQRAAPYIDQVRQTAMMSRAGGYAFGDQRTPGSLMSQFLLPGGKPTAMMSELGLTQQQAASWLSTFGIVQPSAEAAGGLVGAIGRSQYAPGLSMVGPDKLAQFFADVAGAGAVAPSARGVSQSTGQLSDILTKAIAHGMNSADVLQSIDSNIQSLAGAGAGGTSLAGTARFMTSFGNLPGAQSGALGLSEAQGIHAAAATIGTDPARTYGAAIFASRFDTAAKLKAELRKTTGSNDYWNTLNSTQAGRDQLNNYFKLASTGQVFAASQLAAQLLSGSGGENALAALNTGGDAFASALPPAYRDLVLGHQAGDVSATAHEVRLNPSSGINPALTSNTDYLHNVNPAFDPKMAAQYRATLTRLKVDGKSLSPKQVDDLMRAGRNGKTNPLLLAPLMWQESSFGTDRANNGTTNVMQMSGSSGHPWTGGSAYKSMLQRAQLFQRDLRSSGGNVALALDMGGPDGHAHPSTTSTYLTGNGNRASVYDVAEQEGLFGTGINPRILSDVAQTNAQRMASAALTFSETGPFLATAGVALDAVSVNAAAAARALKSAGSLFLQPGAFAGG